MFEKVECFKTQLFEAGEDLFDISAMRSLKVFRCDRFKFFSRPLRMVADPFLFVWKNRLFLFYEQFYMNTKGVLAMVSTKDLKTWSEPVVVLDEPFHLSFPWVFEHDGKVYMIPESGEDKSVRLYCADDDSLEHFSFQKCILDQKSMPKVDSYDYWFGDSSIVEKDGKFYLFTSYGSNGVNELRLFVSDSFDKGYQEHPMSPLVCDNKIGRNAGALLDHKGKLYRVAQDCQFGYGDNVHVLEIDELTPQNYVEHFVHDSILPTTVPFYKKGGHQFNYVDFQGKRIVSTDAKEYNLYFWNRVLSKLKLYRD